MAKTNVKAIAEQRAAALKAMDELLNGASAETRALTELLMISVWIPAPHEEFPLLSHIST